MSTEQSGSPSDPSPAATPKTQTVSVGDLTMAYRVFGQGSSPLVLIMGLTGTMDIWDPTLVAELATSYQVIVFDNRGMGATTNTRAYPFEQLADDTAGLIEALGLGRAHVCGFSMGGSVALDLALRHTERVNKLVLYAADCGGPQAIQPSAEVLQQLLDTSGTPEEQGMRLLGLLLPREWLGQNIAYIQTVFSHPLETSIPENTALQVKAAFEWPGVYPQLGQVRQPTLIVQGMADILTPPANAQLLATAIPGSWLVRLADGGHGLMYQRPKLLASIIHVFLA